MNRNPSLLRQVYPVTAETFTCQVTENGGCFNFQMDGGGGKGVPQTLALQVEVTQAGEGLSRDESGRIRSFAWAWVGSQLHLWLEGDLFIFQREDVRRQDGSAGDTESGDVQAPMPGAVLEVLVSEGDRVERNQTVILMESMKMELAITAPRNAVVRRVAVQPGQQVERGMRLLELSVEGDAVGG